MVLLSLFVTGQPAWAKTLGKLRTTTLKLKGRVLECQCVDINGDRLKDLVIAHLEGDGVEAKNGRKKRFVSVFLQSQNKAKRWPEKPSLVLDVPTNAVMFAAGDFHPRAGGELVFLSFESIELRTRNKKGLLQERQVIKTPQRGFFDFPADGGLFLWDLALDLDNDRRTDLLFPTKDGYLVYANMAKTGLENRGRIAVPSSERFGPPMETRFLNRFLTYISTLQRVVAVDMNGDGRKDLVAYRHKGLAIFKQRPGCRFLEQPDTVKSLSVVEKAAEQSKKKDAENNKDKFANVKLALRDLNNDGRMDIVATKTIGEIGVFESLRTQVLIFLATKDGIQDSKPDRIINLKGLTLFPEFTDFNGDKDIDIVLSSLRMDLFTNVKRAITKSVSTTYTVYLYRGGPRVYSKSADFERSVDAELELIEKQGQVRLSYFRGDINGDGLKDMVTIASKDTMNIVPASVESGFFSGSYLDLKDSSGSELKIPTSTTLQIEDLDNDKKDEIIILYKKIKSPERMTVRIVEAE